MRWIIESLGTLINWAVTQLLNALGSSVLQALTMNIGNDSVFDIVFRNMFTFAKYFWVMGMAILFINCLWQLVKIMTSAEASETPLSLISRTFAAGIAIAFSTQIVDVVQYFFSAVYNVLLNDSVVQGFDMSMFTSPTWSGDLLTEVTDSLVQLLLQLGFTLAISWEFLMFLMECIERYCILGVLYYTSPLAFSTAGSKSTSSIFSSWCRMMLSQHLLMIFNVVFFRMFIEGFTNMQHAVEEMANVTGETSHVGMAMIWYLMMYAILHVGTRMDAYMATLGLSTAQAGRGLGAAVVSSFSTASRAVSTGARAVGAVGGAVGGAVRRGRDAYNDSHRPTQKDERTGNIKGGSIADIANGKGADKSASGKEVGGAFMQKDSDFAKSLQSMGADPNTAKVSSEAGRATMEGFSKNGEKVGFSFIPTANMTPEQRAELAQQQGKFGKVGGEEFFMQAHGSQGAVAQALVGTPEMEKANAAWAAEKDGRSVSKICDQNGEWTGGYHFEEKDASGKVTQSFDMLPQSMHNGDNLPAASTQDVDWGGQACYKVDTSGPAPGTGAASNIAPSDEGRMANKINSQFSSPAIGADPGSGGLNLTSASVSQNGIIEGTTADGQRIGLAPAANFQAVDGKNAQMYQADNGAMYTAVPLGQNADGTPAKAADAFKQAPSALSGGGNSAAGVARMANMQVAGETSAQRDARVQNQFSQPLLGSQVFSANGADGTIRMTGANGPAMLAPVNGFKPKDPSMPGLSIVTANDGTAFYQAPLESVTSASPFVATQPGQTPTQIDTSSVGKVNPVDNMATARNVFQGDQIPQSMTHCEGLQGGAMRTWDPSSGQQAFIVPAAGFNVTGGQDVRNITTSDGQQYVRITAQPGQTLGDVAQQRQLDSSGRPMMGSMKAVPVMPTAGPADNNRIHREASERKQKR